MASLSSFYFTFPSRRSSGSASRCSFFDVFYQTNNRQFSTFPENYTKLWTSVYLSIWQSARVICLFVFHVRNCFARIVAVVASRTAVRNIYYYGTVVPERQWSPANFHSSPMRSSDCRAHRDTIIGPRFSGALRGKRKKLTGKYYFQILLFLYIYTDVNPSVSRRGFVTHYARFDEYPDNVMTKLLFDATDLSRTRSAGVSEPRNA